MKNRIAVILAVLVILAAFPLPLPARAADSGSGEWVLTKTEDVKAEDNSTDEMHYTYERGSFKRERIREYVDGSTANESISAVFSGLPERLKPDENVSIQVDLSSSGSSDTAVNPGSENIAQVMVYLGDVAQTNVSGTLSYDIYVTPTGSYDKTETINFSLPNGEQAAVKTNEIKFEIYFNNDQNMSTTYTYEWAPAAATPAATVATPSSVRIMGQVRSVEDKPMPYFKLQASVYYGAAKYDATKSPDTVIDGCADHEGIFKLEIPTKPGDTQPVGVLLTGTFACVYPYDKSKNVFYFVDMADSFSRTHNQLSLSSWLTVDPAKDADPQDPSAPIDVYRLLAFYNPGEWSIDLQGQYTPDPVYYNNAAAGHPQKLQDYSALYTAAYDAWFFGAAVLLEEKTLVANPLRIELNWPPTATLAASHYDEADKTIRLVARRSKRDDNSRFIIMHEFGHYFDSVTNSGKCRASGGMGPNDVNHGGYFNSTTSDSYLEGFATCYAGLTQQFSCYKNPNRVGWVDLSSPSAYIAWENNGANEEYAIASLLYYAHPQVGTIWEYWTLLYPDKNNFYEYYQALEGFLAGRSSAKAEALADYAFTAGLYTMPFGNNRYDPGEPFKDTPDPATNKGNGTHDAGEAYGDLMFAVGSSGTIDTKTPLQAYDRQKDITIGAVSDYDTTRVRQSVQEAENGYLYLSGDIPEYLLVTERPDTGDATRSLRAVDGNRVYIGLQDTALTGELEVSVPGGNVIYTGDLAKLQKRQKETVGQAVLLAEARIGAGDLAAKGTQAVATYGDANATGVLSVPRMTRDQLVSLTRNYNPDASMEDLSAAMISRAVQMGNLSSADYDTQANTGQSNSIGTLGIILIIAGIVLAVATALTVILIQRRKRGAVPAALCCPHCSAPVESGETYCTRCGKLLAPSYVCPFCGEKLDATDEFCTQCGKRIN